MSKKKQEEIEDQVQEENQETGAQTEQGTSAELDEVSRLKADLAELNDKYLRLYSEFDNFKRRTAKERIDLMQSASKDVITSLLPVMDDFERAEKSFESAKDLEAIKEGIKLVHHKMKSILTQ
ncbi:MAG: nucleotide exchange factor GrpE, partial [Bacteroidota bacterium]|nr:nucleotide exchange factor GrpE [Bacteroidota bacterium]MDX5429991.1 nucleotide exchange factor GrpE [Bacteroidota bacterium]MDX5468764.1 nucleotide exchange factor GrpE [Bacteroidota bacterium]